MALASDSKLRNFLSGTLAVPLFWARARQGATRASLARTFTGVTTLVFARRVGTSRFERIVDVLLVSVWGFEYIPIVYTSRVISSTYYLKYENFSRRKF